ncbi:PAXNEB-domain-containing protein [Mycena alexandri]|uniref:Elongator complex protein 4 n=1 Tax=Mycena alexandri TaxID=1745969 RepID=A0AAD6TAG5_9AGAR|nr:PAXNEB-domain-containing protein [Mycena alexandri]
MSFKRKTPRAAAASPSTTLLSTGVPSLDDILGGGLPLSCSLVLTAPDLHSEYGELVQKYFVAQGLAAQQNVVVVVGGAGAKWVGECMWLPANANAQTGVEDNEEAGTSSGEKIRIAWRYEQMKPFQTTVADPSTSSTAATADACRAFDLTTRIPASVVDEALSSHRVSVVSIDGVGDGPSTNRVLARLEQVLAGATDALTRVCVPGLGSPRWGDLSAQDILRFLHSLRALLRRHAHACASVSLAAEWSVDSAGWYQKLGWVSDGAITMNAFTANPALAAAFPAHHGLLQIHTLPAPTALVPASDRFSTLRGTAAVGGGENNLGFKCTRKRLVFETVHLGVEGGVGDRRTSAPAAASELAANKLAPSTNTLRVGAAVEVEVEGAVAVEPVAEPVQGKKNRKRVGFQSDRPEVYDF